jgi:hypothetical protein
LGVAASTESLRFQGVTVKEFPFFKAFQWPDSVAAVFSAAARREGMGAFWPKKTPQLNESWC